MPLDSASPNDSLSIEALERVAEQLLVFSQALIKGDAPSIEASLAGFSGAERAELLRELLLMEIEHRGQTGELVSFQEYRDRFPDDSVVLADAEMRFRYEKTRLDADQAPPEPGERLHYVGDYELLNEIGRGGMGVVYQAQQMKLGRIVAVKMLLNNQFATDADIARFEREAKLAAKLQHPNIVAVHEVGRHEGHPYFSMDFVEGQSLAVMVRDHPLPPPQAARYVQMAVTAVNRAHEAGILHRDLKPSNILIDQDDQVRITDFGLATQIDADQTLTRDGVILGTASYMPPEQAVGNRAKMGVTSDVYSLGAVLYELLTGRPPFAAATVVDTLYQVKHQEVVAPRVLNPKIPRDLETICLHCLEKEPHQRYGKATELAQDLKNYLEGRPIGIVPTGRLTKGWRWCRRNPALGGVSAAFAIVMLGLAIGGPVVATIQIQLREMAEAARIKAENAAKTEAEQRKIAELQLYYSQIYRAAGDLEAGRHGQAAEVLAGIPIDQRGWEARYLARQAQGTPLTLYAHQDDINCVAFSPNGRYAVSASSDKTAKVHDVRTGEEVFTFRGHLGEVTCAAFSPNGQHIVSGSADKTLKLWDFVSGKAIRTFRGHQDGVTSVAFDPHGKRIVSGSMDKTVKVWDIPSSAESRSFLVGEPNDVYGIQITSVAFSPDGHYILAVRDADRLSNDPDHVGEVRLWDINTGKEKLVLSAHHNGITSAGFSPDGRYIVSGGRDKNIKIWDAQAGTEIATLIGHSSWVTSVAFSPDGRQIGSGSLDGTVRVWDANAKEERFTFRGHSDSVSSVGFSPSGHQIMSGSEDKTMKVWDVQTRSALYTFQGTATWGPSVAIGPNSHCIVASHGDRTVRVSDILTGEELLKLEHEEDVLCAAISPNGDRIVTGGEGKPLDEFKKVSSVGGQVTIWDTQTGAKRFALQGHQNIVRCVAFSPDGRLVASGSQDDPVKIWDSATGKLLSNLRGHNRVVDSVAFSPDGRLAVASGRDVKIWDPVKGKLLSTMSGHLDTVGSVAFSSDGRRIVSCAEVAKVWDAQTGLELLTLYGHGGGLHSPTFSPDGRRIVGSVDNTVNVWDAQTGTQLITLRGHTGPVYSARFSPNGRQIVSISPDFLLGDGEVRVWDSQMGEEILSFNGRHAGISRVILSPDGRQILSIGMMTVKVWDAKTMKELFTLPDYGWGFYGAAYSPDGQKILAYSHDETIRIWNAQTGDQVHSFPVGQSYVGDVAFSRDGRHIVAQNEEGVKTIWDATTGKRVKDELSLELVPDRTVSPDGLLRVATDGRNILLIRKNADYDPWSEDAARRAYWVPIWSAQDANDAEKAGDWFAARFHLQALLKHDDAVLSKHQLPNRASLEQRLAHAEAEWKKTESPQPAVAEKPRGL